MRSSSVDRQVDLGGATLIAGVLEGLDPIPGSEEVLESVDRAVLEAAGFDGKPGQTITLPHGDAAAVILVGVGSEVSFENLKNASGNAVRAVKTRRGVTLLAAAGIEGATRAVVEGSLLGGYEYRSYKTEGEALAITDIEVVDGDDDELTAAQIMAEVTAMARDWVNAPAKDLSPQQFADQIAANASDASVEVEIWERGRIESESLGGLLGVAAGSDRDPRLVILTYRPDGAAAHLALVGKGITFDSGGLSLKTAQFMEEMKDDMSGAAAVVAATIGIARLGLPVSITAITPLTDNAVGGDATRPGDVLRPVQGPTIEVLNTDAEGRLILADGLGLAHRYEPDLTIDVATLTGAAVVALGKQISAVFASDSDVADLVLDAAARAGEEFWPMPLFKGYRKSIDSNIADIKNVSGSRYGGAIVAALFLAEYAGDVPWAHLDIAGPARSLETAGELVKGGSGVSVRTLIEVARGMAETG
ncbi:MAG TPA: leucyl aminopeptidase [Acidimicrobiia bacterium]|nr:leucyl aminopeptidase [Acidimicrobiia bacterium]